MKNKISVVLNTLNEEDNIAFAIRSIRKMADEIVVIDMMSDDSTKEIAENLGAKVYDHERIFFFEEARKFALNKATSEWILVLDADEVLTSGLCNKIEEIIIDDKYDVVHIPRANFVLSGFASHESDFPEYHMRLFKKEFVDIEGYRARSHTFFEPLEGARVGKISPQYPEVCMLHYTNPTVRSFIDVINKRYSENEALERYHQDNYRKKGKYLFMVLIRPFKAFFVHYFKRQGFLDGWRGFWCSIIFVMYEWIMLAKIWEAGLYDGKLPTEKEAIERMRKLVDAKLLNQ